MDVMRQNPGVQMISADQYAGVTAAEAQKKSMDMLDKLREADGIFCPNESSTMGMLLALRQNNLAGKVKFVGFDTSQPLVDAVKSGEIPDSRVAVVISDKADAAGLEKARDRGVETVVIERRGRTREEHDAEIITELKRRGVELVCLAGYMRLLSCDFVNAFPNRIINIHPSLLPSFPGLDAQAQALRHGVKVTGCTVHFVNEDLDAGRIILQRAVEVRDEDTVESLSDRILEQEHKAYIEAVKMVISSGALTGNVSR
jgi:phosphoribosylglycinamide formyltransferase-1